MSLGVHNQICFIRSGGNPVPPFVIDVADLLLQKLHWPNKDPTVIPMSPDYIAISFPTKEEKELMITIGKDKASIYFMPFGSGPSHTFVFSDDKIDPVFHAEALRDIIQPFLV